MNSSINLRQQATRSAHSAPLNRQVVRPRAQYQLSTPTAQPLSTTERIFRSLEERSALNTTAGGAGGATTYADLKRLEAAWLDVRTRVTYGMRPRFVCPTTERLPATPGLDVIVAGGTLGIFIAGALQAEGLRVAVLERGPLRGRAQEWNVSRSELAELVEMGVLTEADIETSIAVEFNPVRVGFHGGKDIWTRDVLNLGVSPAQLVSKARQRFEERGGLVIESTSLERVFVHPNGVQLRLQKGTDPPAAVAAKLLVDCMGNQSPIVRQVRHGRKPDGVCLVVGTSARGFAPEKNTTGDVIYTAGPSAPPVTTSHAGLHNLQTFWEAFPAGSGPGDRTTYMFSYMDAHHEGRPSLEEMLDIYWEAMPQYQGVKLDELEILRVLFGLFPTYRDSPLEPTFDRILAAGDSCGIQSPLSFGGFAALTRHLRRVTTAITDAVAVDALSRNDLKYINAYNPSLSGAWMLQRAMSIPADATAYDRDFINRLLAGNFAVMEEAGDATLRPFLQDVIQAAPLAKTLAAQMAADPLFVPAIIGRVGLGPLVDWLVHFGGLVGYTAAYRLAERLNMQEWASAVPGKHGFVLRRALERWQYGAGLDYKDLTL